MLNQSFSKDTFQEIFDKENRKGKNIEKSFSVQFHRSLEHLKLIQAKTLDIQNEPDIERKRVLYEERKILKNERESIIKEILHEATIDLPSKINDLALETGSIIGKQTYILENTLENFLMSKKVQWNIAKTYKVKQANRYAILSQLISNLEDKFPKYVVRTDIKSFYETIPQKPLLSKINEDYLLSVLSKRFINRVIEEYNRLTGQLTSDNPIGVPRGVGISPYLSELYMRMVDNEIKKMPELVYYSRYVDDVLAIFIPDNKRKSSTDLTKYKNKLIKIIKSRGLEVNALKTDTFNLLNGIDVVNVRNLEFLDGVQVSKTTPSNPKPVNYLGCSIGSSKSIYKFSDPTRNTKIITRLTVDLSEKKIDKYKDKIKSAFDDFKVKRKNNETRAFKLLKARIEFLSSNTRLRNNKANVMIGIYYSNPFINNLTSLEILDRYLNWYISRAGLTNAKIAELSKLKFCIGFNTKRFVQFPLRKEIYRNHNVKRNDTTNANNKGVLRFGLREINSIWKSF